ncbi:DUF6493 family protein [Streptomyces sp. NPDC091292]|uniref:DUF7824 domain-containing protein n=1 Tax=Streptomyces sp. NPDC091292 TaxID=3365991 RepID=UPI0038116899
MSTELLMRSVRSGRMIETVDLLEGMTAAERRACVTGLKSLRKELRGDPWSAATRKTHPVLHAAGAACHSGVVAAATWITAADMRWSQASPGVLLQLLGERDPQWLGDLAHKLAERPVSSSVPYALMSGLVRRAGCDAPTTDAYVQGWMDDTSGMWQRGTALSERLRGDPHLVPLVAALFETEDIGSRIEWTYGEEAQSWTAALVRLTGDGVLDRKVMIEACVARLLRGGSPSDHRAFLKLLKALSLTPEEERERLADWTALAADAPSVVAAHAQSVLGALAQNGELTHRHLAEMSRGVLFRTEKKLVRTQLILLGKILRADPAAATVLLPAVADAFGHEDTDLQERALKLAERHLDQAGPDARDELAGAVEQLSPGLRPRAAQALGVTPAPGDAEPYTELLPPPPERRRVAPAPGSAAEVAEETGALLEAGGGVPAFERVLDGLVRQAYADRAALIEALGPLSERQWWHGDKSGHRDPDHYFRDDPRGIEVVLATLFDEIRTVTLHHSVQRGVVRKECAHTALSRAWEARLWEAAYRIRTEPMPFLLATPTWESGVLEPDELVARLTEYGRLGVRPGEADFAQALLRVHRDPAAAGAASALGTPEGDRLARWLSGGPARPRPSALRPAGTRILVQVDEDTELTDLEKQLPRAFAKLGAEVIVSDGPRTCYHWTLDQRAHWLAVVPGRRDVVAALLLKETSDAAVEDAGDDPTYLPLLAETDGEAGDAVHLAVAYGLGARRSDERLAAVDALLVLAARGQLDADLLGGALGRLVVSGAVKPVRLVESGRAAAATGAYATTWSVLREALVPLLTAFAEGRSAGVRGAGDLLAVAAECAERTGARGAIPRLAEVAERGGSSRLVTQARRLHKALGAENGTVT